MILTVLILLYNMIVLCCYLYSYRIIHDCHYVRNISSHKL